MKLTDFFTPVLASLSIVVGVAAYTATSPQQQALPVESEIVVQPTTTPLASIKGPNPPKPTPIKSPTPKPKPSCIVTIAGKRYNVLSLRRTHSGGNIFVCGTDMTRTFNQQHGSDYSLIAKYRI